MHTNDPYLKQLRLLPIILVILILIFIIDNKIKDQYFERLNSEFHFTRFEDSINDKVGSVFIPKKIINSHQTSYVTTNNNKLIIEANSIGHDLQIPEVITVGSYIYKKPYDSIIIVTNISIDDTISYKFKLSKCLTDIWEKPLTH